MIRRQHHIGTIDATQAQQAVTDPLDLPITVYHAALLLLRSWRLRNNLPAYDDCYIALAEAVGCSFLTADNRLSRAPGTRCPIEVI